MLSSDGAASPAPLVRVAAGLEHVLLTRVRDEPDGVLLQLGDQRWTNARFHAAAAAVGRILWGDGVGPRAVGVSVAALEALPFVIWGSVLEGVDLWFLPGDADATRLGVKRIDPQAILRVATRSHEASRAAAPSLIDGAAGSRADACFVFQTSGTAGEPKVVRCAHWSFEHAIAAMREAGALRHAVDARVFLSQPLAHSYGLSSFFEYLAVGACVHLPLRASPLGPVGHLIASASALEFEAIEGVAWFWSQVALLIDRLSLPRLRHIGFGGGPIDAHALERILVRHPDATVSLRYGLTETPSVVTHRLYEPPHRSAWTSSGRSVGAYGLEIRTPDGGIAAPGAEGEIVLRGHAIAGSGDELATGDLGFLDARGELHVTGRRSAFIKRRGLRISPEAVESAALRCPGITDCRAVDADGRLVLESVITDPGLRDDAVLSFLADRLGTEAVPDALRRVSRIPRTWSGKIVRTRTP